MKILATSDGSIRSQAILPHAARLARALAAEIVVLRVAERREVVEAAWPADTEKLMSEMGTIGYAQVEPLARDEDIRDVILRIAAIHHPSAIAMSSRGAGFIRHAVLGSVALDVLARSSYPLLVAGDAVGEARSNDDEYHFVLTTDGSADSLSTIDAILPFVSPPKVRVTLLRVYTSRIGDRGEYEEVPAVTEALNALRTRFPQPDRVNISVLSLTGAGHIGSAIVTAAATLQASAIAIATHGHGARYHAFMGSTALHVLGHSNVPLFLVRSSPAS